MTSEKGKWYTSNMTNEKDDLYYLLDRYPAEEIIAQMAEYYRSIYLISNEHVMYGFISSKLWNLIDEIKAKKELDK